MNRRQLLATAGLSIAANTTPTEAKAITGSEDWLKKSPTNFIMAYYFEDGGPQDLRPVPDEIIKLAPQIYKKGDRIPHNHSLIGDKGLDVAGLVARAKKRVALTQEQLVTIAQAFFDGTEPNEVFRCYAPHHIVVCYDASGHPTGALEVCLLCQGTNGFPGIRARPKNYYPDFLAIARILFDAGLPLGKEYPTFEAYKADWRKKNKAVRK